MSVETPHRKRKHHPQSTGNDPDDAHDVVPTKKQRKEAKEEHRTHQDRKGKGKQAADASDNEFILVSSSLVVSIPPVFASNPTAGVEEMLDSMLMRYIPGLRGVVLSHSNLKFLESNALIKADCPFAVCKVAFDVILWSPRIGMKLEGRINLCSPDHVSLLIHRTFNASIPRHHIPIDDWEFEYGPTANDPEFGADANAQNADSSMDVDPPEKDTEEHSDPGGRWVHRKTGAVLGGDGGVLEFTVIESTIANEMLSLTGSIQKDPFSAEHQHTVASKSNADAPQEQQDNQNEIEPPPPPEKKKKKKKDSKAAKEGQDVPQAVTEVPSKEKKKKEKKLKRTHPEGAQGAEETEVKRKKKKRDKE